MTGGEKQGGAGAGPSLLLGDGGVDAPWARQGQALREMGREDHGGGHPPELLNMRVNVLFSSISCSSSPTQAYALLERGEEEGGEEEMDQYEGHQVRVCVGGPHLLLP